jgi:hypothetical protein
VISPPESTAAERVRLALDLYEVGESMMREQLHRRFADADPAAVERMLVAWLRTRPGAEHGDGAGRPATWPRSGS